MGDDHRVGDGAGDDGRDCGDWGGRDAGVAEDQAKLREQHDAVDGEDCRSSAGRSTDRLRSQRVRKCSWPETKSRRVRWPPTEDCMVDGRRSSTVPPEG